MSRDLCPPLSGSPSKVGGVSSVFYESAHESMRGRAHGEFFRCTRIVALFTFGVVQQPHDPRRCALDRKVFKTVLLGHWVFTGCSIDERFQPSERRKCCLSSLDDGSTPHVRHLHICTCWCTSSHHGANKTSTSTGSCLADAIGWCVLSVCSYIGNPCACSGNCFGNCHLKCVI